MKSLETLGFPKEKAQTPCRNDPAIWEIRVEILIDDLDGVLDEINTLIEAQLTLQDATGGFLFNTWNGEVIRSERESG